MWASRYVAYLAISAGVLAWLIACPASRADAGDQPSEAARFGLEEPFPFERATLVPPPAVTRAQAEVLLQAHLLEGESLNSVVIRPLTETGITLIEATAIPPDGSYARPVAVDHTGAAVDGESVRRQERLLDYRRHGRFDAKLHARVQQEAGPFDVVLLYAMPQGVEREPDPTIDPEVDLRLRRELVRDALAVGRQPLLQWLGAHGVTEMVALDYYPVIRLTISRDVIVVRALHESLDVASIQLPPPPGQLAGDTFNANASMGEPFCSNCYGSATAAVVIEPPNGHDAFPLGLPTDSPRLYNAAYTWLMNPAATCTADYQCGDSSYSTNASCHLGHCVSSHATGVMGSIGMNGPYSGYAFTGNRNVYPAYASTNDIPTAFNWLTGLGWAFANTSFGSHDSEETYSASAAVIDIGARYHSVLTTRASGNCLSTNECMYAVWPRSYNSLIVGNYSYPDNRINVTSVYVNPGGTDRELPEVVGPGSCGIGDLNTNSGGPAFATAQPCPGPRNTWMSDGANGDCRNGVSSPGGTSFAAPAVLGMAMLTNDWYYGQGVGPLELKAILMTGARDANADGPISINGISDGKDGAGAPDVTAIKRIRSNFSWQTFHIRPQDIGADGYFNQSIQVYVPAGYALRTTMAYNSCATEVSPGAYTNRLVANFDLAVSQPIGQGNTILGTCKYCTAWRFPFGCLGWAPGGTKWSATYDNNYEMVYDDCLKTATQGGTFTIKISRNGSFGTGDLCNGASDETVVVAWDVLPAP
jgi:hypothetical protein